MSCPGCGELGRARRGARLLVLSALGAVCCAAPLFACLGRRRLTLEASEPWCDNRELEDRIRFYIALLISGKQMSALVGCLSYLREMVVGKRASPLKATIPRQTTRQSCRDDARFLARTRNLTPADHCPSPPPRFLMSPPPRVFVLRRYGAESTLPL